MFDLFGGGGDSAAAGGFSVTFPVINETPADYKEQLGWEKELLGMYVSAHPIAKALENVPDDPNRLTLGQLSEEHMGQKVTLIGMLTGLRRVSTKKGDTMLIAQVEDLDGSAEMVVFPKAYEKYSKFWQDDAILAITAKVELRRDALQLVCEQVDEYTEVEAAAPVEVTAITSDFADAPMPNDDDVPPPDDPAWQIMDVSAEAVLSDGHKPHNDQEFVPLPTNASDGNGYNGASNGNGATSSNGHTGASNGHVNGNEVVVEQNERAIAPDSDQSKIQNPKSEMPPTPVTIVRPRQRIEIKKKEAPAQAQPDAPAPSGPQYVLKIMLPRTDDYITDLRCMQEVAKQLQQYRGMHKVTLLLPKDDLVVELETMEGVNPAPPLVQQLTAMLGEGSVALEGVA
jgi:DNA polymerase-3 subunit alpha